jgi:Protein of unknown function (DUF3551)
MRLLLFVSAILLGTVTIGTRAQAQNYPWCALYGGGATGGAQNCGFSTFEQCRANVSGIGGFCQVNTLYVPPAGPHRQPRGKSHKPS